MDIIAQHLKFVASIRIMMEELSTLASGFEVDGGQLRFQVIYPMSISRFLPVILYGFFFLTLELSRFPSSAQLYFHRLLAVELIFFVNVLVGFEYFTVLCCSLAFVYVMLLRNISVPSKEKTFGNWYYASGLFHFCDFMEVFYLFCCCFHKAFILTFLAI